jgi:hypothetical protein
MKYQRSTGNSARSIMAEAIINRVGNGKFMGYSAGSMPIALRLLNKLNYDTIVMRSKSWEEFTAPGAPNSIPASLSVTTPQMRYARSGQGSR